MMNIDHDYRVGVFHVPEITWTKDCDNSIIQTIFLFLEAQRIRKLEASWSLHLPTATWT